MIQDANTRTYDTLCQARIDFSLAHPVPGFIDRAHRHVSACHVREAEVHAKLGEVAGGDEDWKEAFLDKQKLVIDLYDAVMTLEDAAYCLRKVIRRVSDGRSLAQLQPGRAFDIALPLTGPNIIRLLRSGIDSVGVCSHSYCNG